MNSLLLDENVQKYINASLHQDLHSLLLKKSPFPGISMEEIARQVKGKSVAEKKFPFLLKESIVFPPKLNLEQATSQSVAEYKSRLFRGKTLLDLTCGFGIDAFFLSQNFEEISLVDKDKQLLEIVQHNWKILNKKAHFFNENIECFLSENQKHFDLIYIDPARRDDQKKKVFLLEDLSPNILQLQEELLDISDRVLIKLSPLIDLAYLTQVLKKIQKIYILALRNEVKEILVIQNSKSSFQNIEIQCTNLESGDADFSFDFEHSKLIKPELSLIKNYLYIPNNAVIKSGAFGWIAEKFGLRKLENNTQFFTSDVLKEDFPGRILKVKKINSKEIVKGGRFNIISKNYPLKPEEIKKKYKISDGGNSYLIFTKDVSGRIILMSEQISLKK